MTDRAVAADFAHHACRQQALLASPEIGANVHTEPAHVAEERPRHPDSGPEYGRRENFVVTMVAAETLLQVVQIGNRQMERHAQADKTGVKAGQATERAAGAERAARGVVYQHRGIGADGTDRKYWMERPACFGASPQPIGERTNLRWRFFGHERIGRIAAAIGVGGKGQSATGPDRLDQMVEQELAPALGALADRIAIERC